MFSSQANVINLCGYVEAKGIPVNAKVFPIEYVPRKRSSCNNMDHLSGSIFLLVQFSLCAWWVGRNILLYFFLTVKPFIWNINWLSESYC